jgi:hypothetical protein
MSAGKPGEANSLVKARHMVKAGEAMKLSDIGAMVRLTFAAFEVVYFAGFAAFHYPSE